MALSKITAFIGRHPTVALLALFLFHAMNNVILVGRDMAPLTGDEAEYFWHGSFHLLALKSGNIASFLSSPPYIMHPPLLRFVSIPFYLLFGYRPDIAILSTLPALLVLIVSVYYIGKEMHSPQAGMFACALTSLFPGIFTFSRTYFHDLTLAAAVALSMALLIKTKGFTHMGYSVAFGASVGLGLLTKVPYVLFLVGPIVVCMWHSVRQCRGLSVRMSHANAKCLLLSFFIAGSLAFTWYASHLATNLEYAGPAIFRDASIIAFSPQRFLRYIDVLYSQQLGPVFFVSSFIALGVLINKKREFRLLAAWVLPPYLIFTLVVDQMFSRYTLPYLPAFALLISLAVFGLSEPLPRWVASFLLVVGVAQFLFISYLDAPIHPLDRMERGASTADTRNWKDSELVASLNTLLAHSTNPTITTLELYIYSPGTLNYLMSLGQLNQTHIYGILPCEWEEPTRCGRGPEEYSRILGEADIILDEDNIFSSLVPESPLGEAWRGASGMFAEAESIPLPDGRHLLIRRRLSG